MDNCIFCKIALGRIPKHEIYEDEYTFAFLEKHPINLGHIIVIPKVHEPDFYNLDDVYYQALLKTVKKLSIKVHEKLAPKKVGLIVAGWDFPHTHVHIVPMYEYDDVTSQSLQREKRADPTEEELLTVASELRDQSFQ